MSEPLRIAVVAPLVAPLSIAHPYGNQHFLCDLARALRGRGHDVVIYAAEGSEVPGVPLETFDVPDTVLGRFVVLRDHDPVESAAMAQAFDRLFARIRARGFDIVSQHAFDREAILACDGTPALHTLHLPPSSEPVVATVRASESAFCSVSHDCARRWQVAAARPVLAVPNGVPRFDVPMSSVEAFALVAGRISREKGVSTAVRVTRKARLTPLVIGEIYDRAYFECEVAPVLDPVTVIPSLPRPSLAHVMARATALLMPIEWDEPFGLVAVEAQRAGCPVVGYRRGALPEIVADGVDGFLVDPGDEDALVVALDRARCFDRAAIRARAARRYGMAACALRYETALRAVLNGGSR